VLYRQSSAHLDGAHRGVNRRDQREQIHLNTEVTAVTQATTRLQGSAVLSHLRLSKLSTGLLINFHVARLRGGIRRIAN